MDQRALFHATNNYAWSVNDELGHGSFGKVLRGLHKVSGQLVAVKVVTASVAAQSRTDYHDPLAREYEILSQLSHSNIVELIAVEKDMRSMQYVLVMEYCAGGNLHSVIDKPSNRFGLSEEEFLAVFTDLVAGLRYLNSEHIIHRDLKPSNILITTRNDKTVYKLCDFGGAKRLAAGQEAHSTLQGTEEYLNPHLHKRAFLREPVFQSQCNSDLWSIGVTLFQMAAGHLPFRPYRGRADRQLMNDITSKKPSGSISGIQYELSGPVVYCAGFPNPIRLSSGLKIEVTRLLASLLETEPSKMWSFAHFFKRADELSTSTVVHLFNFDMVKGFSVCLTANVDGRERIYDNILTELSQQIDISEHVSILAKSVNGSGFKLLEDVQQLSEINFTQNDPLLLFTNADTCIPVSLNKLPKLASFEQSIDEFDKDADESKRVCALAYYVERKINDAKLNIELLRNSLPILKEYILEKLGCHMDIFACYKRNWKSLKCIMSVLQKKNEIALMESRMTDLKVISDMLGKKHETIKTVSQQIEHTTNDFNRLDLELRAVKIDFEIQFENENPYSTVSIAKSTEEVMYQFLRDRALKAMPAQHRRDHENYHNIVRKRLSGLSEELPKILESDLFKELIIYHSEWWTQSRKLLTGLNVVNRLGSDLNGIKSMINAVDDSVHMAVEAFETQSITLQAASIFDNAMSIDQHTTTNTATAQVTVVNGHVAEAGEVPIPTPRKGKNKTTVEVADMSKGLMEIVQHAQQLQWMIRDNGELSEQLSILFNDNCSLMSNSVLLDK